MFLECYLHLSIYHIAITDSIHTTNLDEKLHDYISEYRNRIGLERLARTDRYKIDYTLR